MIIMNDVKIGDLVAIDISSKERSVCRIKEINETRVNAKLAGFEGSFQRGHFTLIRKLKKALFLRSIPNCAFNDLSFDLYINPNLTATIRPTSLGHDLPRKNFIKYQSIDEAECHIETLVEKYGNGINLVIAMRDLFLGNDDSTEKAA